MTIRESEFEGRVTAVAYQDDGGVEHPTAETLIAYEGGALDRETEERVLGHLADCHECALVVADLATFPHIEPRAQIVRTAADEEEDWQEVARRLDRNGSTEPDQAAGRSLGWFASVWHSNAAWLRAAAVGAATVLLLVLVLGGVDLLPKGDSAQRVEMNIHFQELIPSGRESRRSGQATRITVPRDMGAYLLFLELGNFQQLADYELRVLAEDGEVVLRHRGLRRTAEGGFTVRFARSSLPAGRYRFEVRGVEGEAGHLLAVYDVVLALP